MAEPGGVSVVIPLYNKAATAARAIRSVLAQGEDVELVVVDDGSTDGSADVARSFGDAIVLVEQSNAGPSAARNRGVAAATRSTLAFLDADDEYLPGCIAAHLECRRRRPAPELTLAPFRLVTDDVETVDDIVARAAGFVTVGGYRYFEQFHPALMTGVASGSICIDRAAYLAVGGFDERLRAFEISDFLYRVLARRAAVGVLDRPFVVIHREPDGSQFLRAAGDLRYGVVKSHNILDHLPSVPPEHRRHFLDLIDNCRRELLRRGAAHDLRQLSARLAGHPRRSRLLDVLGRAPAPVVRAAGSVLRVASRARRWVRGSA